MLPDSGQSGGIVGPFTGEVGYELLYWIPYLRWKLGDKFKDATAITRGSAGLWYPCKTIDAIDVVGEQAFLDGIKARPDNCKKPRIDDPLDRLILDELGLETDLHPSVLIKPKVQFTIEWGKRGIFERLPKPERLPHLPERYTAVRLYYSDLTMQSAEVAKTVVEEMDGYCVLLKMDRDFDDHPEFDVKARCNVVYPLRHSLETISRVVAHADRFICTYGGPAYLGPMYGVPTVAVTDGLLLGTPHQGTEARMAKELNCPLVHTMGQ